MTRHVAVIVGSLRKDSVNRKVAHALSARAPASLRLEIVEIGKLPLFNADDEAAPGRCDCPRSAMRCAQPMQCCLSPRSTTARCRVF